MRMAGSNGTGLKDKLQTRAETAALPQRREKTVFDLLSEQREQLSKALPKHITVDRMLRTVFTAIRTTPKLQECTRDSQLASVFLAGQLGLEPGPLGHSYLVPYRNNKTGTTECQFLVGYKGLVDLMYRSGQVKSISVHEVCENDRFEWQYGVDENLVHQPVLSGRGTVKCYYGVVRLKDGGFNLLVMSREDIENIRKRSRAATSGPWVTDYDAMARKTVLRQMARWLPLSVEVAQAIAHDEGTHHTVSADVLDETPTYDTTADEGPAEETPPVNEDSEPEEPAPARSLSALLDGDEQ